MSGKSRSNRAPAAPHAWIRNNILGLVAIAIAALLLAAAPALGDSRHRDPTFSDDGGPVGVAETQLGIDGEDIAIDSKGRIVIAFSTESGAGGAGVARLLPDGTLDTSFSGDGVATYGGITRATRMTVDFQDRVLFVGYEPVDANTIAANVVRFSASGQLDNDFDSNGSRGLGNFNVTALQARPDGRVVMALVPWNVESKTGSGAKTTFLQLTPSGAKDGTFGTNGVATLDAVLPSAIRSRFDDLVFGPGGTVVAAGWIDSPDRFDIIVRLRSDGTPDPTLNGGNSGQAGYAALPVGNARAVAVDGAGRTLVVHGSPKLTRLTADGRPDSTFGTGGVVDANGATSTLERPSDVFVDSAGRIFMAGGAVLDGHDCFFLARFTTAGLFDNEFGTNGASLDCAFGGFGRRLAVDATGRGVMVGRGTDGADVIRYLPYPSTPPPTPTPPPTNPITPGGGSGGVAGAVETNARNVDIHRVVVPRTRKGLARRGVRVLASCDENCRIVLEVRVSQDVANAMGLDGTLLGRGSVLASAGKSTWVTARLSRSATRALRAYTGQARLQLNISGVAP